MKGSVATSGDLPASGNVQGDAYLVQADDSLWIWDGTTWVSGGSIQGPPGSQGPVGPQGIQGPQGPVGATGSQGPIGNTGAQGPIGNTGAQGPQGNTGAQGNPGVDGNTVLYGATNPAAGQGVNGNFYINTTTNFMFGPKAGGAWPAGTSLVGPQGPIGNTGAQGPIGNTGPQGPIGNTGAQGPQGVQGPTGAPGNTVLYGAANPTAGTGVDGNFYINTTTNFLFGPKAGGAWPAGTSLVGPQGPQGIQGPPGTGTGDMLAANNLSDVVSKPTSLANIGGVAKAGDTVTGSLTFNANNHYAFAGGVGAGFWLGAAGPVADRFFFGSDSAAADNFRLYSVLSATNLLTVQANATPGSSAWSMTGTLTVAGTIIGGDIYANRGATQGVIFLGSGGSHYLYFDGTNYTLQGAPLIVGGGGTFNGNLTLGSGGTTGVLYFGNTGTKYLQFDGSNFTLQGGANFVQTGQLLNYGNIYCGYSGTTGSYQFGNTGTKYLTYDGTNFIFYGGAVAHHITRHPDIGATDFNASFTSTPPNTHSYGGETAGAANAPVASGWFFHENYHHSNASSLYGVQIAYGWAGNDNEIYNRSISGGAYGAWVRQLNSVNYSAYALPLSGGTVSGNLTVSGNNAVICSTFTFSNSPTFYGLTFNGSNIQYYLNNASSSVWRGSDYAFIHNYSAYKPGGGSWADSSDARIKTVLGNYENGLDAINALRPVRYTFKGNDTHEPPEGKPVGPIVGGASEEIEREPAVVPYFNSMHCDAATKSTKFIGLVAQECEGAMPEIITKVHGYIDGAEVHDLRNIDTGPLVFALINAVKELSAKVAALEAKQ
jgi:hypothetical protein